MPKTYYPPFKERYNRGACFYEGVYKNGPFTVISDYEAHKLFVKHNDVPIFKLPFEHIKEYDTV